MKTLILVSLLVVGCGADDPAPVVTVMSATPKTLTPADDLADDLRISVRYADADGDLGDGVARVHDCRAAELVTVLPIPPIAPTDVIGRAIEGDLTLIVTDVGDQPATALPDLCSELGIPALGTNKVVFCVTLVDAADHEGPGDCTAELDLTL
jgi:hypothetical protein